MAPGPIRRDPDARVEAGTPSTHAPSLDVPQPQHGHQLDRGDDSLHPTRPGEDMSVPRHAGSVSNPFPSFFSAGKKNRPDGTGDRPPDWDSDASDDRLPSSIGHRSSRGGNPQRRRHHRHSRRDFTAGPCMTCGTVARCPWPSEPRTFECVLCSTINDLVPKPTADPGGSPAGRPRGTPPHAGPSRPRLPPPTGTSSLFHRGSTSYTDLLHPQQSSYRAPIPGLLCDSA